MTKERLEESIKQNGLVYFGTYNEDDVFILREIKLSNCFILDNELHDEQECCYYDFIDLFETKEQAKWHCKMDAEHTQRFEPPLWEEIEKAYHFYFYIKSIPYAFHVDKNLQLIEFSRDYMHSILIYKGEVATKENYEKACEKVRDLVMEDK